MTVPGAFARLQNSLQQMMDAPVHAENEQFNMTTRISVKSNPFSTTITLDITCDQSKHVIVKLSETEGKILRMFGWYLMKGTNVTAIHELRGFENGEYRLDVLDQEGVLLYSSEITKN